MGIALQVKSGPLAGRIVTVPTGQSFLIGRSPDRAQLAVPHDNQMSGVHFAVECDEKGSRLIDKKSSNGTFLNGARAQETALANGDEIKSGQTIFVVRIVPDDQLSAIASGQRPFVRPLSEQQPLPAAQSPAVPLREIPSPNPVRTPLAAPLASVSPPGSSLSHGHQNWTGQMAPVPSAPPPTSGAASPARPGDPPALVIGSWVFQKIPKGWQIQEGLGIQQVVKDAFPASIGAIEEPLGPGLTLQHYVDAHTKMFREYLRDPKIEVAVHPVIHGSVETVALEIQYSPKEGPSIFFRRDYVRCGSILGVLTLTALGKDLPSIRPVYDSVLSAISFSPKELA
jgi:pSer/pThr/pTyr-binding forkhead associated (FHA) protein